MRVSTLHTHARSSGLMLPPLPPPPLHARRLVWVGIFSRVGVARSWDREHKAPRTPILCAHALTCIYWEYGCFLLLPNVCGAGRCVRCCLMCSRLSRLVNFHPAPFIRQPARVFSRCRARFHGVLMTLNSFSDTHTNSRREDNTHLTRLDMNACAVEQAFEPDTPTSTDVYADNTNRMKKLPCRRCVRVSADRAAHTNRNALCIYARVLCRHLSRIPRERARQRKRMRISRVRASVRVCAFA